jgi:hypothetical protein
VSLSVSVIIGDITLDGVGVSATSRLIGWERKETGREREMEKALMSRCTSGAMITISTPTFWAPPMLSGVSIDLNVQYYHPVMAYVLHLPPL